MTATLPLSDLIQTFFRRHLVMTRGVSLHTLHAWTADRLRSDKREKALALWAAKGKEAFETDRVSTNLPATQDRHDGA
jgi:hypothetical protein